MSGGRPLFYRSYAQELALFNTRPKLIWVGLIVLLAFLTPFLVNDPLLQTLALGFAFAIGALGLNIVTGLAGQVSLGHAFFLGIGAYTAAAISGDPEGRTIGYGITNILVWLPAAGLVAALAGVLVAPLATRLRGLYLAIVTLGLVFLGEHIFREWSELTGGVGVGREAAIPELFGYTFSESSEYLTKDQNLYLLMLVLLLVFALGARNLARSRVGRAFAAVRDRDMAAEMMAINLPRTKTVAFGISSFYAGCSGAVALHDHGLLRAHGLQPPAVGAVHRHGADRRGRDGQRHHHGRAVHLTAAHADTRAAVVRAAHLGAGHRHPQRLPARVDPLRPADRGLPALRASRALRHLDPDTQLLEGLAVQLLSARHATKGERP